MARLEITRHIQAPPAQVFDRLTDFAHAADTIGAITAVEMLTDGAVGVGTRFRETRVVFGREATEEMEVVAFDPPKSYALGAKSHGARYLSTFTFTEKEGGTDVALVFEATPLTLFAKIMSFLAKPMMKKVMAECAKDLDDVAKSIESVE